MVYYIYIYIATCTHRQVITIIIDDSCPWLTATDQDSVLQCVDGSFCNWNPYPEGRKCCDSHQGRAKCPKDRPIMCEIGNGGSDYGCAYSDSDCGNGPRLCDAGTYW